MLTTEGSEFPEIIGDAEPLEDERRPIWMPPLHYVLALAVLICIPSLFHFVSGSLDPGGILVRFLFALLIAWAGLTIVGNVVNAYLPPPEPPVVDMYPLGEGDDLSGLSGYTTDDSSTEGDATATGQGIEDVGEAEGEG